MFSVPRLDRRLEPTGSTTIELPAQPPGQIRFTCGMGRYRGRIVLVDVHRPPILTRVRHRTAWLDAPLVLWISSLPLVALVAVVALDFTAALAAAGAALVAWVAGWRWASQRSARPSRST